jgi:hypothetical protein
MKENSTSDEGALGRTAGNVAIGVAVVSAVVALATSVGLLYAVSAVASAVFLYFAVPRPGRGEIPKLFEGDKHSDVK